MLGRILSMGLLIIVGVIVVFNFKAILSFGRAHEIERSAQKAIAAHNWEKGIELYEAGHKQFPENEPISTRLAWLYLKNQQPEPAEANYRDVLKRNPDNQDALIGLTEILKKDPKRINEAVTLLRKALKTHAKDAKLIAHIGNLYKTAAENPLEQREKTRSWLYDQARYYYQRSLQLDPKQFQTQFNLGVAFQNMNDCEAAAKAYCQAILIKPNSYQAHYNMGLTLSDLNYLDESYRQLDRAVKILGERNEMSMAQDLALKVQNVKNRIFNSNRKALTGEAAPDFLDKGCLVQPMADASMKKETMENASVE